MPYWQHIWQTHVHLHMGILVFFKHIEFSFKFSRHFGEKFRHHHPFFSFSFFIILPTKHPLKILSSLPHNLKTKHSIYVATLLLRYIIYQFPTLSHLTITLPPIYLPHFYLFISVLLYTFTLKLLILFIFLLFWLFFSTFYLL